MRLDLDQTWFGLYIGWQSDRAEIEVVLGLLTCSDGNGCSGRFDNAREDVVNVVGLDGDALVITIGVIL